MPNLCNNELTVVGDEHDVKKFMEDVKTDDEALSFEQIVPMPNQLKGKPYAPYGCWGRRILWGTKWDAQDVELVQEGEGYARFKFDTAWQPPLPFIIRASQKYPKVCFDLIWDEPGIGFFGRAKISNGAVTEMAELESKPKGNKIANRLLMEDVSIFRWYSEPRIEDKEEFVGWLGLSDLWNQECANDPVKA